MLLKAEAAAKPPARVTVPLPAATLAATATVIALIALPALARDRHRTAAVDIGIVDAGQRRAGDGVGCDRHGACQ